MNQHPRDRVRNKGTFLLELQVGLLPIPALDKWVSVRVLDFQLQTVLFPIPALDKWVSVP